MDDRYDIEEMRRRFIEAADSATERALLEEFDRIANEMGPPRSSAGAPLTRAQMEQVHVPFLRNDPALETSWHFSVDRKGAIHQHHSVGCLVCELVGFDCGRH